MASRLLLHSYYRYRNIHIYRYMLIYIYIYTNVAVFIANLFCFTYEYEFVTRCVNAGRVDLLSKFRYTMRYIDDLLSADNSLFEKYIYLSQVDSQGIKGIYPDFLTLNCEEEGQEVSF